MWHIGIHMDRVKGERGWGWAHAGSYHQAPVIFLGKITEKHSNWSWWNWWKLATGIFSIEFSLKNPDYVDQLNPQQKKVIVICKICLQFSLKWVFLVLVLISALRPFHTEMYILRGEIEHIYISYQILSSWQIIIMIMVLLKLADCTLLRTKQFECC